MTKIRIKNNIKDNWTTTKWYSVADWYRHVDDVMGSRSWEITNNDDHPEGFDDNYPRTHNFTISRGECYQEQTDNPPTHDEFRHEFLTDDGGEYEIIQTGTTT